jgi:dephospho-CoA kinase
MLSYGLTGGIGSGKSSVAEMFRDKGIPTFDADELGHELLEEEGPITASIIERHPDCKGSPSFIDRRKLAAKVFSSPAERRWIEDLLHPAIWKTFITRRELLPRPRPPACLLEGALLMESRSPDFRLAGFAGFLVVTAPVAVRLRRLQERDKASLNSLEKRLAAQLAEHEKILAATHLIDNSGNPGDTRHQVEKIYSLMLQECGGSA